MSRRRQRRQPGLSMSERRRRRVRWHRRFSVPEEVRGFGFPVDGGCRVWKRHPRPGPLAHCQQSRALCGAPAWTQTAASSLSTGFCFGDPPAVRSQCSVPGLPGCGGQGAGWAWPERGPGAELGAHQARSGYRPSPLLPTPKPRAASWWGAWLSFPLFQSADCRRDL